jgi:DNA-directed RNA polymerase subunit M/transcription elongation factor TFIIS
MTGNARACPKCKSGQYSFRSRKPIEATEDKPAELETKYRCKDCEHEWKERAPGTLGRKPAASE